MGFGQEFHYAPEARRTSELLQAMLFWRDIINASESDTWREYESRFSNVAKAISFSVENARQGLVFVADVMSMVGSLQASSKKQRKQIFERVKASVLMGAANATGTMNEFNTVWTDIYTLLGRTNAQDLKTKLDRDIDVCKLFLSDFEELRKITEKLWSWWGGVENAMPTGSLEFRRDYDLDFVKKSLKDLASFYTAYIDSFGPVLKQNPKLFPEYQNHTSSPRKLQHSITDNVVADDSASVITTYSEAQSSIVTDYGLFYTRRASNSFHSLGRTG